MPTKFGQQRCWRISLVNSAPKVAALVSALEHTDPQLLAKMPLLKIVAENWAKGKLSDQEFLHRAQAETSELVDRQVRQDALKLVGGVRGGVKALNMLKHAYVDRPDSDFDKKELELGRKSELEHTSDPEVADIIAKDHLQERPTYYSDLAKAGLD